MLQVNVPIPVRKAETRAVVTRCGCGLQTYDPGHVCPRPGAVEDLGRVAYFNRNPVLNLIGNALIQVKVRSRQAWGG